MLVRLDGEHHIHGSRRIWRIESEIEADEDIVDSKGNLRLPMNLYQQKKKIGFGVQESQSCTQAGLQQSTPHGEQEQTLSV